MIIYVWLGDFVRGVSEKSNQGPLIVCCFCLRTEMFMCQLGDLYADNCNQGTEPEFNLLLLLCFERYR